MKLKTILTTLFIIVSALACAQTLPIETDFSVGDLGGWTEVSSGNWEFDEFGGYWQGEPGGALVSPGFEAYGTVHVKIVYGASAWGEGAMRVVVVKTGLDCFEASTNDGFDGYEDSRLTVYEDIGFSGEQEAEFDFDVAQAGIYQLMIVNEVEDEWGEMLRLKYVRVSAVKDFDLRIGDVRASLSPFTPMGQISAETPVTVTVKNCGKKVFSGIKATAFSGAKAVGFATLDRPLQKGETAEIMVLADLSGVAVGDVFSLRINVEGDVADEYPEDNVFITPTVEVTETVRACEGQARPELGVGAWEPINIGNVYALAREDVLTGVEIGLTKDDEGLAAESEIGVAVYEIEADGVTLGRALFSETMRRGEGGNFVRIPLNPTLLRRGEYFFEVAQLTSTNMGLAYELGDGKVCYQNKDGRIERIENGIALAVRGIFEEALASALDVAPVAVVSPRKAEGLFRREQRISASVKNLGFERAEFTAVCFVNRERLAERRLELLPYETAVCDFGAFDMSAPGKYTVEIETVMEGDECRGNDRLTAEFRAVEERNPYVMDFEACDDFDCQDDVFNPRWKTIDRHTCGTDGFWAFAYPHHSQSVGFIAFNPDATSPSMTDMGFDFRPHSGERFGAAFAVDPFFSGEAIEESDVWLISPKLRLADGARLEFFVKTRALEWNGQPLERYQVLVSEGEGFESLESLESFDSFDNFDNFDSFDGFEKFIDSFIVLGEEIREAPADDWQQVCVDLSAYDHKAVHVAIRYLGLPEQNVVLMVDDITVHTDIGNGIDEVNADDVSSPSYNLQGIRVSDSYKGLIIKRGHKHLVRQL